MGPSLMGPSWGSWPSGRWVPAALHAGPLGAGGPRRCPWQDPGGLVPTVTPTFEQTRPGRPAASRGTHKGRIGYLPSAFRGAFANFRCDTGEPVPLASSKLKRTRAIPRLTGRARPAPPPGTDFPRVPGPETEVASQPAAQPSFEGPQWVDLGWIGDQLSRRLVPSGVRSEGPSPRWHHP
jgi:hypothetical protein